VRSTDLRVGMIVAVKAAGGRPHSGTLERRKAVVVEVPGETLPTRCLIRFDDRQTPTLVRIARITGEWPSST
jgi:hypothetical protein